jgi:hypothetical protein
LNYSLYFYFSNVDASINLSFFPLYNYYAFILSVFFLPSNQVEDDITEEIIQRGIKADNEFEKELEKLDLDDNIFNSKNAQIDDDDDNSHKIVENHDKDNSDNFSLE